MPELEEQVRRFRVLIAQPIRRSIGAFARLNMMEEASYLAGQMLSSVSFRGPIWESATAAAPPLQHDARGPFGIALRLAHDAFHPAMPNASPSLTLCQRQRARAWGVCGT